MANVIKLKRGSGSDPGASDLVVGEIALRTDTGKIFTKKDDGSVAEISGSGGGGNNFKINTISQSNGTGGGSATFNGSAYRFTLSDPPGTSVAQCLVSVNGVIQKPVAGTSQPAEGFAISGNDILFSSAPASGADYFIVTYDALSVTEVSDNSVDEGDLKISNAGSNGQFLQKQSGNTGGLTWAAIPAGVGGSTGVDFDQDTKIRFGDSNEYELFADSNSLDLKASGGTGTINIKGGTSSGGVFINVKGTNVAEFYGGSGGGFYAQHNSTYMYKTEGGVNTFLSHIRVSADSTYDIGTSSVRFANGYFDTLYGSGANLTALPAAQLTGTVAAARLDTATTQSAGNNSTKIATTAYADTAISNLVDSSPSALNTLNELAAALGDDANFSTTVTNSIATKLPLAGGTLTGALSTNSNISLAADGVGVYFGASNDLRIRHNSNTNFIETHNDHALKITKGANSEIIAQFTPDAGVDLYHNYDRKFATDPTGIYVYGADDGDGHIFLFSDTGDDNADKWRLKASASSSAFHLSNEASGSWEDNIKAIGNGAVELYFDNSKHFETTSTGAYVTSRLGVASSVSVGTSSLQNASVASFKGSTYNQVNIAHSGNSGWGLLLTNSANSTSNYHRSTNSGSACAIVVVDNESLHLATNNQARWSVHHTGHFLPDSNNTYDIGNSTYRVRNLYINDLQLSNKGSQNDVDGTWGDWTLQEGEEDIFMINNRSGKKYKMALQEVS